MKKRTFVGLLALLLLLSGCQKPAPADEGTLHIVATTYPVYLFTTAVTEGAEGVEVALMINQPAACLHDYTLTVADMKKLESADVLVKNGVGLENFMSDALKTAEAAVIDTSAQVHLLKAEDGSDDPHIWMSPENGKLMVQTIADALAEQDPTNAALYAANAADARDKIDAAFLPAELPGANGVQMITFHDGFRYFSEAFSFPILKAIEEEEGSEASAREIQEMVALVKENHLPAIFTEENGATATAEAIARETGAEVFSLSMLMSGEGSGIDAYIAALRANRDTVVQAFSEGNT